MPATHEKKKTNRQMIRCMGCMSEYEECTPDGETVTICPYCGYVKDTPAKEAYHLPPGSILQKKYIVGKVLGYGGFGVTYAGYDAQLDRKIAIKEYLPTNFSTRIPGQTKLSIYDGENGEQFLAGLKSFVDEGKRLSKLNPLPGTVDIYDSFQQNETGYIVMEYLEGKTVKEWLAENGVFGYDAAKKIILGILATLKEVHKEGIIHRDIAPDNIFLLEEGEARLIDFGASRYATTLHSKSLSVILKPGYAPEEQYRSRGDQGAWSDVYALAATFYKMITGITPGESMERMMKDDLKEPSKLGVKIPVNDENAIMNALLVKASDRTQNADEFERQLTAENEVKRAASTIQKYDTGRIPKWARILASCLGGFAAVFGLLLLTGVINLQGGSFVSAITGEAQLAENETRVPNVIGELYEAANTIAEEASLMLVVTDKDHSDKVETDKVMLQDPLPGRVQQKDSVLNVIISAGLEVAIEKGIMPDVVFRTLEKALSMLEEAGIPYELTYEESDTVLKGNIIGQSIESGEKVAPGTTVTIIVSSGSEKQDEAIGNSNQPIQSTQPTQQNETPVDPNAGKTWVPDRWETITHPAEYTTVHHPAEYNTVNHPAVYNTIHHDAVYRTVRHDSVGRRTDICNICGQEVTVSHFGSAHPEIEDPENYISWNVWIEVTPAWEEQVVETDAWDEQVLVSAAWDEQVLVKAAWDEQVLVKGEWVEQILVPGYWK